MSKEDIEKRMRNQWTDEEKGKFADIIIENIDMERTKEQVRKIHSSLI